MDIPEQRLDNSLPKRDRGADTQEHVRGVERELDIVDHQENHVTISVHEITGPSGSVFALEIPPEYAKEQNVDSTQKKDLLNRAIVLLEPDTRFPVLVMLPTMEGEGMTSEPHRLFVVATRAGEGQGGHRADLITVARKAKALGKRVKLTGNQVDLTINAPVDTIASVSEVNLYGALGALYSELESIHGYPDHPTNLRVVRNPRNAYRMTGNTRAFALTVALI